MAAFPFPPSSGDQKPSDESKKKPEFIYLGDEPTEHPYYEDPSQEEPRQTFAYLQKLSQIRFPFLWRVLSFFLSLLCLLWSFGALICAFPFAVATLITLGRVDGPVRGMMQFVDTCKKAAALGTGFFIFVFSPLLGLSFLFLVYLYRGEAGSIHQWIEEWSKK